MNEKQSENVEMYRKYFEFHKIGNIAVRKAQDENRRQGIPNVYSRNGKIYYELPNGELTEKDPLNKEVTL